jgi:hypothetical protein
MRRDSGSGCEIGVLALRDKYECCWRCHNPSSHKAQRPQRRSSITNVVTHAPLQAK